MFQKLWNRTEKAKATPQNQTDHSHCENRLYHCCPHHKTRNCVHYWCPEKYNPQDPCMFVTETAHLARPKWKYLDPARFNTMTEDHGRFSRCKNGLKSLGKAARRYYFGPISPAKAKNQRREAKETARESDIVAREKMAKDQIKRGYLGLGVWQQDLDQARMKQWPMRVIPHFQSMDKAVMAGVTEEIVETKPKEQPATSYARQDRQSLVTAGSTCSHRRTRAIPDVNGRPILQYESGEIFDAVDELDKMWLAVSRGDSASRLGRISDGHYMKPFGDFDLSEKKPTLPAAYRLEAAREKFLQSLDVLQDLRQNLRSNSQPEDPFRVLSIRDFDASKVRQFKASADGRSWKYRAIDRSKQLHGFGYIAYGKGDMFDVYTGFSGLWLVVAQKGPKCEVGWVWKEHFAIMKAEWSVGEAMKMLEAGH